MPKACQPPPPRPTQNNGPAERSGAERRPARSDGRQLQPTSRQLETTSLTYVSAKCLRFGSHEIPGISIPGQAGFFTISRTDTRLTVNFQIGGTAGNGVDYTNLAASVTFGSGATATNIYVQPLADTVIENAETVTLTLIQTNEYYVDAGNPSATVTIQDSIGFETVVTNLAGPIGIDDHAPSNSIIVSSYYNSLKFSRIYTNLTGSGSTAITNTIVTNWSGITALQDEVKLATVKTNAGGFTNGDMFFGSNTGIGWLSADATRSNLNWCVLTNSTVTNALLLRGSLYVDQTGVFSNQLIAVTSPGIGTAGDKGVWRVDAQGHPTLLATINTPHLEGVITLPNTNFYGPLAGQIITGDEDGFPNPLIFTIAANGVVTTNDTTTLISGGIYPEDFDIIPPNQNLYACDFDRSTIVKLSANYFTNFVGDLLIPDAGEISSPAKLFILHWNAATTNFVIRSISYDGRFEHVTFAPMDLPSK